MSEEVITLKWGTLKGWDVREDNQLAMGLLQRYHGMGMSLGCGTQHDTAEQKQVLAELVSLPGMRVYLDWDGKYISVEEAVNYIANYGKEKAPTVKAGV